MDVSAVLKNMILLSLLVFLFGQQIANGIGCENGQMQNGIANYTLSVATFVGDNNITLTCTSSEMLVTSKKYLKWTEKGRELPNSYHVSRNGTTVTINIINASYLDIGAYTCRCYNNYSVAEIEEIYYSDHKYYHHCSEPFSIQAVASASSDQLVTISDHIVETFNAVVEINCTDETNLLHDTSHSSESIEFPLSVIVNSPSKQGKYVCIDQNNNMLKEIHYIQVKDYEAPVFLIPSLESSAIDSSPGTVPVCAVYSSLPVTFLQYSVMFFNSVVNLGDNDSLTTGLYLVTHSGPVINTIEGHLDHCVAKTVWETVEINYDLQVIDNKPLVPSVCLSASVDPYATEIIFGQSFTVHCVLYSLSDLEGKIVELLHININGTKTQLPLNYSESLGHDVYDYMAVVNNVSESNIGEYICMFRLDTAEYQLRENDSITINSILRPTVSKATLLPSAIITSLYSMAVSTTRMSSTKSKLLTTPIVTVTQSMVETLTSSSLIQPIMYIIIAACSIIIFVVSVSVCLTVILVYHCKKRRHKVNAVNTIQVTGNESKEGNTVMEEIDVWSIGSFSSIIEEVHSKNRISENMAKCAQALIASNWYIPYDQILFHECLGSGAFGKVKRAEIYGINNSSCVSNVAVKMLKDNASEEDEKDIIIELRVLQNVESHKNIVGLLGASLHNGQLLVIVEYCPGGDLLHYLRKKKHDKTNPMTVSQQIDMGRQVACGMEYLSSKKCVHRDLAARNILIAGDGTLKVSDFGLARETYHSMYKMSTKGKIPFKWMAPESIFYRVYTSCSDVWSFGVLLWEIITLGWSPYPGKSVENVISDLQKQKLMARPPTCSVPVFNFILLCWRFEPTDRPSFSTLVQLLEEFDPNDAIGVNQTDEDTHEHSSFSDSASLNQLSSAGQSGTINGLELISIIPRSNFCSQCKEDDYSYTEEFQESEGYISCCENKRGSPVTDTVLCHPPIDFDNSKGVRMCNLCKLELIKRSNSELGSAGSDVFTDSEADVAMKVSPISVHDYSQKSGGSDSGLINDLSPFVIEDHDTKCTVLWPKKNDQNNNYPEYLQTMYRF